MSEFTPDWNDTPEKKLKIWMEISQERQQAINELATKYDELKALCERLATALKHYSYNTSKIEKEMTNNIMFGPLQNVGDNWVADKGLEEYTNFMKDKG